MSTYNSFIATHPFAKGQEIYDAGVKEGLKRAKEGDHPAGLYNRDEVTRWRNDAIDACAEVAKRGNVWQWLVDAIEGIKSQPWEPRYSVTQQLPVCSLERDSLGVAVDVWLSTVEKPVPAFYGMRANDSADPHPKFYFAGAHLSGVTHWRYRKEEEQS